MLPIPTPSIFIISDPICIKSDPKNDVIPLNFIKLSTTLTWSARVVVIAVDTTGDWIILSRATITFAFWFVATNLCDVPIPTLSSSTIWGIDLSAFSELVAILILLSSTLTTNKFSSGKKVVFAEPTKLAVAIPTADVAVPTWLYFTFSPLTKKWFGILIVFVVVLIMSLLLPKKYLSKIGSSLWDNPNSLLISDSVPKYSPKESPINAFVNVTDDARFTSSLTVNAFI